MAEEETLYLGYSAPIADEQIDQLVREFTMALPLGALLNQSARKQLRSSNQPHMSGRVSDSSLEEDDFRSAFNVASAYAPQEIGVKLIVGHESDPDKPRINLIRQAETIRAQKAVKQKASDLLYGPRRR